MHSWCRAVRPFCFEASCRKKGRSSALEKAKSAPWFLWSHRLVKRGTVHEYSGLNGFAALRVKIQSHEERARHAKRCIHLSYRSKGEIVLWWPDFPRACGNTQQFKDEAMSGKKTSNKPGRLQGRRHLLVHDFISVALFMHRAAADSCQRHGMYLIEGKEIDRNAAKGANHSYHLFRAKPNSAESARAKPTDRPGGRNHKKPSPLRGKAAEKYSPKSRADSTQ